MKSLLQFVILLLAWTAFCPTTARAQTPQAKSVTVGNVFPTLYNIPGFTATGTTAVRYRFNSVPTSGIVAYPPNADGTGSPFVQAVTGTIITAAQAARLVYQPANTTTQRTTTNTGTFIFDYSADSNNNGAFSSSANYTINVRISADDQTAVIMPNTNGQTAIPALSATSSPTAPSKYRILALPSASAGSLFMNGVAVTANQDLTITQAGQLTFDPAAGFAGNAFFAYAAADTNNDFGTSANYSLPVSKAACGVTSALDFSRRGVAEDWKARTATIGNTILTTSGYTSSVTGTNTNTFAIGNNGALPGPALVWQQNNIGNNPATVPNVSTVTFTFSRPVSNLSLVMSDIDKNLTTANLIDEITFDSYSAATSTTPLALGAADVATVPGINELVAGTNTIRGTGNSNNDPAATVVITFPGPVQRIILTYRNTAPYTAATDDRTQTVGIPSLIFCAQAEVFARFSSGTTATTTSGNANYVVDFGNNGADPASQLSRTVTLPPGVTGVVVPAGATYNATTRVIDFGSVTVASGATAPFAFSFNAPATVGAYSIVANASSPEEDPSPANNTASVSLTVTVVDVTTILTGPASLSPGQPTATYTAIFANNGPSAAAAVTRQVTLPADATNVVRPAGATLTGSVIDFGTAAMLASGASTAFLFSFTPATTAAGTLAVSSNVTTTTAQGSNTAPDASTITALVAPTANVATVITATTPSVAAGTLAAAGTPPRFSVTFSNGGPAAAGGVTASVQLPRLLTNVTATNGGGYDANTGVVSYAALTAIANGSSSTSVITFDAPATGPVVAIASIATTSSEAGQTTNNTTAATVAITPAFDLTTTISGPASAVAGNLVTLAVTTTNNGPSAAANAVLTLQLASGLANVYVSNGGVYNPVATTQSIVSNGVSYPVPAGGVVFPALANLPGGQSVANSVSYSQPATAFAPSALATPNTTSTATSAGDTNTANNTAFLNGAATSTSLAVTPAGDGTANAYTRISASGATTAVGSPITLTVVTGNNGPGQATGVAQIVQILPGLPAATLQVNGSTGTPSGTTIVFANGTAYNTLTGFVTFAVLTNGVAGSTSGTSVSNTITFSAPASTGANGQLLAMAAVRTTNTDPIPADNVSSVAVTLLQTTDLVATIGGPALAVAGQLVTYAASFTNNGPMTATGVTETVQLPAGLSAVTITDAAGNAVSGASYGATTGQVTFPTLALDPSGATQVFKLIFAAPAQSFGPRSSVGSTSPDAVAANNSASLTTAVAAAADLTTTVAGPATAVVGNAVTYSVTTTNNGPLTATNAVTTLQLAAGLTIVGVPNGAYNSATGLVTFNPLAVLACGASTTNSVTFVMPNAADGQTTGVSTATAGQTDPIAGNNAYSVATSVAPATPASADLTAAVAATAGPVAAGATGVFTATYGNIGTDPALNVLPTLQLTPGFTTVTIQVAGQPGALSGNIISFANGATYNTQTGVVAFPTIASQATGAGANVSYAVTVTAPATGPLAATAAATSNTSEPATPAARTNNVASASTAITASFDGVTSISGPASALPGTSQTYTVTTTSNGPSPTANATTQTVTVPAGQTPTNITNGGVYSSAANIITWTIAAGQSAGSNGAVANSFTIAQPAVGVSLTAAVIVTGESNTGNNTATITTTAANQPPLAYAVVNVSQNPMSNSANVPLAISSLLASDPENAPSSTTPFTIVSIPAVAQGGLYFNSTGTTYALANAGQTLTSAQAASLRFQPNSTYAGNAAFTYLATDAASNQSPAAGYTIPISADKISVYARPTVIKGGNANKYVAGDVLAYGIDPNAARYNSAGLIYDPATGAAPATGTGPVSNGLQVAKISAADSTTLAGYGIRFTRATALFTVFDPALLPRAGITLPAITVASTDHNGGSNTNQVALVTGANPLPVELTAFTATALKNIDARLVWRTASEKNNDRFNVERSLNGTDFVKIGQVKGQGNTPAPTDYTLTDTGIGAKVSGPVYYRLQQVDCDGTATYSPVRTVAFIKAPASAPAITLFPNPATTTTGLDLTQLLAGIYQVSLLDATGRVVMNTTLSAGLPHGLALDSLANGIYTVLVRGQNGREIVNLTKRLIKE